MVEASAEVGTGAEAASAEFNGTGPRLAPGPAAKRFVVVEVRVPLVLEQPADASVDVVEFYRNGNPSCASNWADDIARMFARWRDEEEACDAADEAGDETARERHPPCPCDVVRYRYVREATVEEAARGFATDSAITEEIDVYRKRERREADGRPQAERVRALFAAMRGADADKVRCWSEATPLNKHHPAHAYAVVDPPENLDDDGTGQEIQPGPTEAAALDRIEGRLRALAGAQLRALAAELGYDLVPRGGAGG